MAKQNNRTSVSEEHTDTVIYGPDGKEILRFGFHNQDFEEGDNFITEKEAQNYEIGDGTVVNPTHLMNGKIMLTVCDECKRYSRSSLFGKNNSARRYANASRLRRCFRCGANLCSRHYVIVESHVMCRSCRRRHIFLHKLLKPIFCKRV